MKSATARKKKIWVGAAILFWLTVGVAVPIMFDFAGDEVHFDSSEVVAATRDNFKITEPVLIDKQSGTTISGGTLGIVAPKGTVLTAESSAALLKRGEAVLLLRGGELMVGNPTGQADSTDDTAAPLVRALQEGRFKALALRQGTIIVALPNGHRERLTRANVQMMPAGSGAVEAKGQGFWRGQRSKFVLETAAPAKNGSVPIKLSFNATLLDVAYEGAFQLAGLLPGAGALQGPTTVHLKNTEQLANALGTSWPIGTGVQDVRIEGPLRWDADTLAFDQATVRVGDNDAEGTVSLKTSNGRALISSTLAFEKLDVAPYLPNGAIDRRTVAWQWWSKLVGTLSQPAAPHINADIRLSAKELSAGTYTLGPGAATVSMKDGKLSADIAEIALANGRVTGQISIDFNRYIPKLALRGRLEEIASGQWSETLAGKRYIEGQGRIVADLTSQGVSIHQIINDLAGKVEFSVPENGAIGLSLVELNSAPDKSRLQTSKEALARVMRGSTVVNDLEAVLQVKEGVAKIIKASATHPAGSVRASGSFDMMRSNYDFRMLSLIGIKAVDKSKGAAAEKPSGTKPAPTVRSSAPSSATFLSVTSAKPDRRVTTSESATAAKNSPLDNAKIQLRALSGPLPELERFLGYGYSHIPRRGL
ncbi:MAG: AsmA-like C-terminal region-containing protein [Hyphomicrobiaceae bacterium]